MKLYPTSIFEGVLSSWSFLPKIFDSEQRKKNLKSKADPKSPSMVDKKLHEESKEELAFSTKYNDMYLQQALAGKSP